MPFETILQSNDGPIATIVMNRPKALNALNRQVFVDLTECLIGIAADRAIRAIVIKGAGGRAFGGLGDCR